MARRVDIQPVYAGSLGGAALPGAAREAGLRGGPPRLVHEATAQADIGDRALIDARRYSATLEPSDEVGVILAHAVAALREGAPGVVVRLGLGNDFLMQIAKLRALRATWARVLEVAGVDAPLTLWAGPDASTWTVYDPWVNLLRNTAGTFAALVGGADQVTPLPFDAALGASDPHAQRLADNTFNVLVHEAHLATTIDPAAGSWAIEAWSAAIAAEAWAVLLRCEAEPTQVDALIAELAAATHAERAPRIVKRLDGIIGTSLHPNPDEARPVRAGMAIDRGSPRAAPFEALRARGEAARPRPSVFLAGLGPLAEHTTRLGWVKGLYEVAGIVTLGSAKTGAAYDDVATCVADATASGAPVVVLCGSDDTYRRVGADLAQAIHDAGLRVVLAGRPKDLELPVDSKVYAGMDVVAALAVELDAQLGGPR